MVLLGCRELLDLLARIAVLVGSPEPPPRRCLEHLARVLLRRPVELLGLLRRLLLAWLLWIGVADSSTRPQLSTTTLYSRMHLFTCVAWPHTRQRFKCRMEELPAAGCCRMLGAASKRMEATRKSTDRLYTQHGQLPIYGKPCGEHQDT